MSFVVKSQKVLLNPSELPKALSLLVEDQKISRVGGYTENFGVLDVRDFGDLTIMSGLVDTHAHINEPGRTEWEGFVTATRSAAAGGITTVIDMPLNSIPATTSVAALQTKRQSARGNCSINYGFWGGVIPGNLAEVEPMVGEGVMGFKCFLCPSGVEEFPPVSRRELLEAMPILARHKIPLIVHAEIESPLPEQKPNLETHPHDYFNYLESRPQSWEVNAIRMMIELAKTTNCRTHIVHLSAADALEDLAAAQRAGVPITAETCPHYLVFDAEHIQQGATHFKCAPPIREARNRERLWTAVKSGLIEFIVSDHSPCTPNLKLMETGDFSKAWGGIAGLQFSLSTVWSEMHRRGFNIADLSRLMSYNTSKFLGLNSRKGQIQAGHDADFVVWDPNAIYTLTQDQIYHRHKVTPYLGQKLRGRVHHTFVGGKEVFNNDKSTDKFLDHPQGTEVLRKV